MKEKELTYRQLEEITGISSSVLQRYVTNQTNKMSIDYFEKIAKALNVKPSWLMWGSNEILSFEEVKEHSAGFDFSDPEEQIHALEQSYKAQKIIPLDETLSLNTTIEDWQILLISRQLNEEGREKLINYGVDLVMSGRHKKSDKSELVEKKA